MKKLLAIILAITLTFSMAATASAATIVPEDSAVQVSYASVSDSVDARLGGFSIIDTLMDLVHRFVEKIFAYFGLDCPLCDDGMDDDFDDDYEYPYINDIGEVLEFYNTNVNTLISDKSPMSVVVDQGTFVYDIEAPDSVYGIVQELSESFFEDTEKSDFYVMENGVDANGVKLTDLIPTVGEQTEIAEDIVAFAEMDKTGEYASISISGETCNFDGTTTSVPELQYLVKNIELADFGNGMVKEGSVIYYGTEFTIWLDQKGRIESISASTPVDMDLIVDIGGISAAVTISFRMNYDVLIDYVEATGVVAEYNNLINALKFDYDGDMVIDYTNDIDCELVDSSASALNGVINSLIDNLIGKTERHHVISEGYDEDGRSVLGILPPGYQITDIRDEDVVSATKEADGDETVIRIKLKEDISTYDGENLTLPEHHMNAVEILNPAALYLGDVEITSAEMNYSGATIEARLDSQGRLVYLQTYLPVNGTAVAKINPITVKAELEGSATEIYEIEYK